MVLRVASLLVVLLVVRVCMQVVVLVVVVLEGGGAAAEGEHPSRAPTGVAAATWARARGNARCTQKERLLLGMVSLLSVLLLMQLMMLVR